MNNIHLRAAQAVNCSVVYWFLRCLNLVMSASAVSDGSLAVNLSTPPLPFSSGWIIVLPPILQAHNPSFHWAVGKQIISVKSFLTAVKQTLVLMDYISTAGGRSWSFDSWATTNSRPDTFWDTQLHLWDRKSVYCISHLYTLFCSDHHFSTAFYWIPALKVFKYPK